jgi:hypothetical protein
MESWANLTQAVARHIEPSERKARLEQERFNLFTTLLKPSDEVRLHSRFLHCLIDPAGTHDQGPRFLELFFQTLEEHPAHDHDGRPVELTAALSAIGWQAERETRRYDHGQLDLLLTAPGGDLAWVIENKIYHHEGDGQIKEYAEYLRQYHSGDQSRVFLLTLHGRPATSAEGEKYYRLSYSRHILRWLEKCSQAVDAGTPVHQAILQYQDVVRQLVGSTLDHPAMQDIKNQIREMPSIIRYRIQVDEAIKAVQCDVADEIANAVRDKLADEFTASVWGENGSKFEARNEGCYLFTPLSRRGLTAAPLQVALQYWTERSYFVVGAYADDATRARPGNYALSQKMLPQVQMRAAKAEIRHDILSSERHWPIGWLVLDALRDDVLANWLEKRDEALVAQLAGRVQEWAKWAEEAYTVAKDPAAP